MKELHWSKIYLNFVTIEVTYSDGARQGWDYDCSQFNDLDAVKINMANDFLAPRPDWELLMVHATRNGEYFSAELEIPYTTGAEFAQYIFDAVEDMLNGN